MAPSVLLARNSSSSYNGIRHERACRIGIVTNVKLGAEADTDIGTQLRGTDADISIDYSCNLRSKVIRWILS